MARSPLLRRLLLAGALAATCSYFLLVLQAQASAPARYDGFAYGGAGAEAGAVAWKDAVLVEAFLDPLCSDSRDSWAPLRLAVERYSTRVSLIVHPFPLPYHTYSFMACRALHIANKLNSSSTYPLLELFFKNQERFSNGATSSASSTAVTGEISKMASQAVGNSVSEFQSGFSDSRTDSAARVSFKSLKFDVYSPGKSSTSRKVPCSSSLCDLQTECSAASSSCPYSIEYLSDNTSSNGVLVEDVLYLTTESGQSKITQAPITFGCGQIQTGSFLGSAAPNGLLGLGMASKSVPSLLATKGIAANSFSMCFGEDGHGRINFGDTGSSDQLETPLNIYKQNPYYNISITGFMVGNKSYNTKFSVVVDSGTSFTALSDPMYTEITTSFNAQAKEKKNPPDSSLPFEFCYLISSKGAVSTPNISLTTKGGSMFPVNNPIIIITDASSKQVGYCLAIMKSEGVNLIGENFMSGLKVVFDRERLVLGWKTFNCYNVDSSSKLPVKPNPSSVPTKPAMGPSSSNPEAAKGPSPNITQIDVPQPSSSSFIQWHLSETLIAAIALLCLATL